MFRVEVWGVGLRVWFRVEDSGSVSEYIRNYTKFNRNMLGCIGLRHKHSVKEYGNHCLGFRGLARLTFRVRVP